MLETWIPHYMAYRSELYRALKKAPLGQQKGSRSRSLALGFGGVDIAPAIRGSGFLGTHFAQSARWNYLPTPPEADDDRISASDARGQGIACSQPLAPSRLIAVESVVLISI
jgi:hypothetical protein